MTIRNRHRSYRIPRNLSTTKSARSFRTEGIVRMDFLTAAAKIAELDAMVQKLKRQRADDLADRLRAEGLLTYFRSQADFWKFRYDQELRAAEQGRKLRFELEALLARTRATDTGAQVRIKQEKLCLTPGADGAEVTQDAGQHETQPPRQEQHLSGDPDIIPRRRFQSLQLFSLPSAFLPETSSLQLHMRDAGRSTTARASYDKVVLRAWYVETVGSLDKFRC